MTKIFNKSFVTNFIALAVIAMGYLSPVEAELIKAIGFFALSGAITNWLAIHMLFEEVPFLYGSGVIPNRFEEFKSSIKNLMMNEFFTLENIEQFIQNEEKQGDKILNIEPLVNAVDYNKIYDGLITTILESSLGAVVQMVGGEEVLTPLREPFIEKMKLTLVEMVESEHFKKAIEQGLNTHKLGEDIIDKVEIVIDKRLRELTPQIVKQMVQDIIRQHLGWLVVWGGVFGGIMGAGFSFL